MTGNETERKDIPVGWYSINHKNKNWSNILKIRALMHYYLIVLFKTVTLFSAI